MKNILFLISSGYFSNKKNINKGVNGPEIRFREFLKLSKSRNFFKIIYGNGLLVDDFRKLEEERRNIKFYNSPKSDFFNIIRKFFEIIKTNNIDIVHSQGPISYDCINIIFSFIFKYQSVITRPVLRKDEKFKTLKSRILFLMDYFLLSKATNIIAISNYHYTNLQNYIPRKKITLIFNGVDLNKFSNSNKGEFIEFSKSNPMNITFISQFTDVKRQDIFLESLKNIKDLYLNINFVGTGPNLNKIKSFSKNFSFENHKIYFHGHLNNISEILRTSHVNCLISDREGLPVSMLEAQASGCVLIGSDIGAMNEIIQNGENGFLINNESASHEIGKNVRLLYKKSSVLVNMINSSRIKSQKFNILKMIEGYEKIYDSL